MVIKKRFIPSAIIVFLVIVFSSIITVFPTELTKKEVAGVTDKITITPSKVTEKRSEKSIASSSKKLVTTPTITKTPETASIYVSSNNQPSNNSSNNSDSSSIETIPTPTEVISEQMSSENPTSTITPSPTDVPVIKNSVVLTPIGCNSSAIGACQPIVTPTNGTSSNNTVTLNIAGNGNSQPPVGDVGGDVIIRTGELTNQ